MDRGISSGALRAPTRYVAVNSFACGHVALGRDGFSIPGTAAARGAGYAKPQGPALRSRTAQASVLHPSEVLSRDGKPLNGELAWQNNSIRSEERRVGKECR